MVGLVAALFPFPPLSGSFHGVKMLRRLVCFPDGRPVFLRENSTWGKKRTQKEKDVISTGRHKTFPRAISRRPRMQRYSAERGYRIKPSPLRFPGPPVLGKKRYRPSDGAPKLTSKRTPEWRPPARAESFIPGRRPTHPNVMEKRPRREALSARRRLIGQREGQAASRLDTAPPPSGSPSPRVPPPLPSPSVPSAPARDRRVRRLPLPRLHHFRPGRRASPRVGRRDPARAH